MFCRLFAIVLIILIHQVLYAQSCCSGGVPISSNIGFSNKEAKVLQLSINADFNFLSTLFSGDVRLDDDLRKRTTQSYIFRGNYSINSRLSAEWFIPFIRQTRSIYGNTSEIDFESSFGIGDPIALLNYQIVKEPISISLGVGPEFGLGSFSNTNNRGLLLVEDLQPGSGSLDWIIYGSMESRFFLRPSSSLFARFIYKNSGSNPNSRNGRQEYKFGNDLQLIAGVSDQFFLFNQLLTPSLSLRYRTTKRDQIDKMENSGTGGNWLFGKLSIGMEFANNTSVNIQTEIPLYSFVNETQLSPDVILGIGIYKLISFDRSNELESIIKL